MITATDDDFLKISNELKINEPFFRDLLKEFHEELEEKERTIESLNKIIQSLKEKLKKMDEEKHLYYAHRSLFKPCIIPSLACEILKYPSKRLIVKIAESENLFDNDDIALRINRVVRKKAKKHETIVLFSQFGIYLLKLILIGKRKEVLANIKKVSDKEMKEIIDIFGEKPNFNIEYRPVDFQ